MMPNIIITCEYVMLSSLPFNQEVGFYDRFVLGTSAIKKPIGTFGNRRMQHPKAGTGGELTRKFPA